MQIDHLAAVTFALAVGHTFSAKIFHKWATKYPEGSVMENIFHLFGEVEVVFGLWSAVFLAIYFFNSGSAAVVEYVESRNFTEPLFVFVIMAMCATRPIIQSVEELLLKISRLLPTNENLAFFITALILGPLLGSFITEPAAMTVTAVVLSKRFFGSKMNLKFKYATLGLLFVNVSIGGTLTPYAAPPVLMVARTWGWDLTTMLTNFGWKAALAIGICTIATAFFFQKEISSIQVSKTKKENVPIWATLVQYVFLAFVVLNSHHPALFIGIFLFFLGFVQVTGEFQDELKLKESLLVAFFLGGLVVLGGLQRWWLEPLIGQLSDVQLYLGGIGLTAVIDNAALTYLGSLVPQLAESSKYALVAGSVVGGGLTVIANAPNPAGYGILNPFFGSEGIQPLKLLMGAALPTVVAAVVFWFF